jgi:hypothetical protein
MSSDMMTAVARGSPVEVDWKGVIINSPMSSVVRTSLDRLQQGEFFLPVIGPYTSAWGYSLSRSFTFFLSAAKVYVPVHLISLIFRFRHLSQQIAREKKQAKEQGVSPTVTTSVKAQILKLLVRYLSGVIRSSMFVTIFASSISLARSRFMGLDKLFNYKVGSWAGLTVSAIFAAGILVESSSRWADMSIYVLAQWLEAFPRFLLRRSGFKGPELDRKFALGEKLLFALGMGILLAVRYWEEVPEQGGKNGKLLDMFVGDLSLNSDKQARQTYSDKRMDKSVPVGQEINPSKLQSKL